MAAFGKQSFTLRDVRGYSATMHLVLGSDTAADLTTYAATLPALINAVSNAVIVSAIGPYSLESTGAYGTNSEYANAVDKAELVMQASDNTLHKVGIPAPILDSVFYADGETVDPSATELAALITALTGATSHAVAPRSHAPFNAALGGMRIRVKNRRRTNIRTLTPDLGGPDE
jgi:hypothetical protein